MLSALLLALNLNAAMQPAMVEPDRQQIIWTDPRPMTIEDWIWGPQGEARAPRPPFRFVSENFGATGREDSIARKIGGPHWMT